MNFWRTLRALPPARVLTVTTIVLGIVIFLLLAVSPFLIPFSWFWKVLWEAALLTVVNCILLFINTHFFAEQEIIQDSLIR